jgi:hypothetical protein
MFNDEEIIMADMELKSFNAIRAKMFGKELTGVDKVTLTRSSPQNHSEGKFSARYQNISFSATMQDHCNCARFKMIDYSHPEYWETVVIPMTDAEEDSAWSEACSLSDMPIDWLSTYATDVVGIYYGQNAIPYDLIGVLSRATALNIIKPDPNKIWCSEAVNMTFVAAKSCWKAFLETIKQPIELFPHELDMLARYYFQPTKLDILKEEVKVVDAINQFNESMKEK